MLSLQTLTNIETLLLSRSHPLWGEFMPLAQTIADVQAAKQALQQSRVQPVQQPPLGSGDGVPVRPPVGVITHNQTGGVTAASVPASASLAEDH